MYITNQPDHAHYAVESGVERIFIDLEIIGKVQRQGHLDTVISRHHMKDVKTMRAAVPEAELLVRLNPFHDNTQNEIEEALKGGADILMIPMIEKADELKQFCDWVDNRAKVIPLIETPKAVDALHDMVKIKGVSEVYIGLNDLHLAMKSAFMFEPLAQGLIDDMVKIIKDAGLPFGFGGIARVGEGLLPAERILGEHLRLGSSSVILSRTFKRDNAELDFKHEVAKLRHEIDRLSRRTLAQREKDHLLLKRDVSNIINKIVRERKQRD